MATAAEVKLTDFGISKAAAVLCSEELGQRGKALVSTVFFSLLVLGLYVLLAWATKGILQTKRQLAKVC